MKGEKSVSWALIDHEGTEIRSILILRKLINDGSYGGINNSGYFSFEPNWKSLYCHIKR